MKKQLRYNRRKDKNCNNYLDTDGTYVFTRDVKHGNLWEKEVVARIKPDDYPDGAEIIIALSDMDYNEDCQAEDLNNHMDKVFQKKLLAFESAADDTQLIDPWEEIAVDDIPEEIPENEYGAKVREFILTLQPQQKELFYKHLGQSRSLEELRLEEQERTGKRISQQAYSNRWNKILIRACSFFGVPKPRKRK